MKKSVTVVKRDCLSYQLPKLNFTLLLIGNLLNENKHRIMYF